jgi:hypothetical protein
MRTLALLRGSGRRGLLGHLEDVVDVVVPIVLRRLAVVRLPHAVDDILRALYSAY